MSLSFWSVDWFLRSVQFVTRCRAALEPVISEQREGELMAAAYACVKTMPSRASRSMLGVS